MTTLRTDSVLDRIVELKRRDLAEEIAAEPLAGVRAEAERAPHPAPESIYEDVYAPASE